MERIIHEKNDEKMCKLVKKFPEITVNVNETDPFQDETLAGHHKTK